MTHARRTTRLLALALVALIAAPALAQTKAKAPRPRTSRPAALDRQRMVRPNQVQPNQRIVPRQTSIEPRTLQAQQQRINDIRRLGSPVLSGTGVPAGRTPRDALTRRLIALQRPALVRSFGGELGSLGNQTPEVLGTTDAFVITEGHETIRFTLEYTRVYQVQPDIRARSSTAQPMDRVIAALSGAPLLSDAQYNDRNAIYQERSMELEARFAEQGFVPISVGEGQRRFVKSDDPSILAQPYCYANLNLPAPVRVEGSTDPIHFETSSPNFDEPSFIPVLELSDEMLGLADTPIFGSAVSHPGALVPVMPLEDAAVVALRRGETDLAIDLLQARVAADPEDAPSIRLLGVARLLEGETAAGIRLVDQAYLAQPDLADSPLGVHTFPGDRRGCRKALREVVKLAHVLDDPRAWLTAAVLMQVEDRAMPARRMIDRARKAGLEAQIADAFEAALR